MNTLIKKLKAIILAVGIAFCVMFGTTQQSKAAFYNNYYSLYLTYYHYYLTYHVAQYYYDAIGFLYYYYAGYYGDYYGYYADPIEFKSTVYRTSEPNAAYYYNAYAYDGDYYFRL